MIAVPPAVAASSKSSPPGWALLYQPWGNSAVTVVRRPSSAACAWSLPKPRSSGCWPKVSRQPTLPPACRMLSPSALLRWPDGPLLPRFALPAVSPCNPAWFAPSKQPWPAPSVFRPCRNIPARWAPPSWRVAEPAPAPCSDLYNSNKPSNSRNFHFLPSRRARWLWGHNRLAIRLLWVGFRVALGGSARLLDFVGSGFCILPLLILHPLSSLAAKPLFVSRVVSCLGLPACAWRPPGTPVATPPTQHPTYVQRPVKVQLRFLRKFQGPIPQPHSQALHHAINATPSK